MGWASDAHSYQHTMSARGDVAARLGSLVARGKLGLKRWGASDAVIKHALLNAETAKVYSRRQGASFGVRIDGVEVGVEYDRRSVHHVWRNKKDEPRHDHFPGSWKIGRTGNAPSWDQDPIYASLGYWDGLRPYLRIEREGLTATLRGPLWAWKDLTLPWPAVRVKVEQRWRSWRFGFKAQGFRHRAVTGTAWVGRHITGPLRARASAGWAHPPQWRDVRLDRVAFGFVIDTDTN